MLRNLLRRRANKSPGAGVIASAQVRPLEARMVPAVLTVTSAADTPYNQPPQPGTLRATLAAARDGDVIKFDRSLFGQTIQTAPSGGPEGFVIDKNVSIVGPGADKLTIRGINGGQIGLNKRVFDIRTGITASISGLTIAGGSGYGVSNGGGGVRNFGNLCATDVVFSANSASFGIATSGGAVFNAGSAFFNRCEFADNSVTSVPSRYLEPAPETAYGGAVYSSGGRVDFVACSFARNRVYAAGLRNADAYGGAIYSTDTELNIRDCTFGQNYTQAESTHTFFVGSSATGGAIVVAGGSMNVDKTTFTGNSAQAQDKTFGGSIAILGGSVTARRITVDNNIAISRPVGPMYVVTTSTAFGGGIAVAAGSLELRKSTIENNSATTVLQAGDSFPTQAQGGGIYNASETNRVTLRNTDVVNNHVVGPLVSGADLSGTFRLIGHNCITSNVGSVLLGHVKNRNEIRELLFDDLWGFFPGQGCGSPGL